MFVGIVAQPLWAL